MKSSEVIKREKKYLLQNYARPDDFVPVKGKRAQLFDEKGKAYLDFACGIAVNPFGHAYKPILDAINKQSKKFIHVSNLYHYEAMVKPAELLVKNSCADRVFFCNSGTEANEAAIKFARRYGVRRGGKKKIKIIAFKNGFHGRTYGALSATAQPKYQKDFGPMLDGFVYCDYNDPKALKREANKGCAAIMVEFLQGEGGGCGATNEFVETLVALSRKHDILIIADEIQSGLGRTGKFFCHEWYGVKPDIITVAKPLGGGLPLGATLVVNKVAEQIKAGDHGTTFGGNPVACAVSEVVLSKVADKTFLNEIMKKGNLLATLLRSTDSHNVIDVRGRGLWVAVELREKAAEIITAMRKKGLLTVRAGEQCIRFLPPLTVTNREISEAVAVFREVLSGF